jgi:glutathione synthase/RimK-type ligase-like ATP-grasp enzyme
MWTMAQELVVKPAISAGSKNTGRFARVHEQSLRDLVTTLLGEGRTVMLQPYMKDVDDVGETAVIYLGDQFSHAIYKGPLLEAGGGLEQGLFRQETIRRREATPPQRRVAEMALDAMPVARSSLLYARIDLVPGPDELPCVLEVELAEPSLFLSHDEHAAERFAACIAAAANGA